MRFQRTLGILAVTFLMTLSVYAQTSDPDAGNGQRPEAAAASRLIGSWVVDVGNPASPAFHAFHTFHIGGTMSETTDLLAQGGEGPGQGAWVRTGDNTFASTFELFIFNPDTSTAGRIRVRETITLVDENHFTGIAVADLLLPDGEIVENIDTSPINGVRVSIVQVKPEEAIVAPTGRYWSGRR